MRFHTFLLKYGEIGIKGKNRHLFEDALVRQVRYALKDVDGQFDVHKSQARIYVDCEGDYDYDETVEHLKKVFGLVGICPVVRMEDKGFEELKKDVVAYMDEMYPDKNFTFKVESRRAKKSYPLNSMAGRNQWCGDASGIRRYRQPGCRIHGIQTWSKP